MKPTTLAELIVCNYICLSLSLAYMFQSQASFILPCLWLQRCGHVLLGCLLLFCS